jgi:hypothetical protein
MEDTNKNGLFDQEVINTAEFLQRYNKLLTYISENTLIDSIEEAYRIAYSNVQNAAALSTLNNILFKVFDGDAEYIETLNIFMQNLNVLYNNRITSNSQINARLRKLRNLYIDAIAAVGNMIVDPFNIASISASIQQNSPAINISLVRNDGEKFSSTLNFNSMMNLLIQFTNSLNNKFKSGSNAIDLQLTDNYIEQCSDLIEILENFKKEHKLT